MTAPKGPLRLRNREAFGAFIAGTVLGTVYLLLYLGARAGGNEHRNPLPDWVTLLPVFAVLLWAFAGGLALGWQNYRDYLIEQTEKEADTDEPVR